MSTRLQTHVYDIHPRQPGENIYFFVKSHLFSQILVMKNDLNPKVKGMISFLLPNMPSTKKERSSVNQFNCQQLLV